MTVENDGVPPGEGEASAPDGLDPPTELLPLDAAAARKLAVDDAAARKAQLNAQGPPVPAPPPGAGPPPPSGTQPPAEDAVAEEPTRVLPLDHQAGPAPSPGTTRTTQGSLEGDLFDDEPAP